MQSWPEVHDVVLRIGGRARLETDPSAQLESVRRVAGDEEFAEWMRDYQDGHWVLVALQLFAEVANPSGVSRLHDDEVRALFFGVPHRQDNLDHARDVVYTHLDALHATLVEHRIHTPIDVFATLPVTVELDAELGAVLTRGGRD